MVCVMLLATLLVRNQDDLSSRARPLIEKLRSERIEEREDALRELRKLGRDVLPLLRKMAQDPELEFAGRVQTAIRAIDLREKLKAEARDTGTLDAASIADWISMESGRRLFSGEDLGLRNRKVRVTPEGLEGDAYELGLDLLKAVDIAAVPEENDPRRVTLVPAPIAAKRGVRVYTSVDALPRANEFCSLVLATRHLSPRDLQAVLINVVTFPQNCLSMESAGKIVMSDYASNLRKLARLVEQLDVPRPAQAGRVSLALLSAAAEGTPSVPEPFRGLRLPETTGRNHFALAAEGFGRLETPPPVVPGVRGPVGGGLAVRLTGDRPYVVEVDAMSFQGAGFLIERLALRSDAEGDRKASPLLQTRLLLKKGEWSVAGSVPSEKPGTSLILLVRADPD